MELLRALGPWYFFVSKLHTGKGSIPMQNYKCQILIYIL
jgi:hypothetical protein